VKVLLFVGSGAILVLLGCPLYLAAIPPNSIYGFRVGKTLGSNEVWYAVNRTAGLELMLAGGLVAGIALLCYWLRVNDTVASLLCVAVLIASIVLSDVHCLMLAGRLSK
jgi:uncharacterized membrane protein